MYRDIYTITYDLNKKKAQVDFLDYILFPIEDRSSAASDRQ